MIFHVDVNSAFLSWTAVKLLEEGYHEDIRNIPSAIAGGDDKSRHGIILAKSEPAKKYNIKTAMTVYQAKKNCPQLQFFSPDFATFHYHSDRMYNLLTEYSPIVQRFSIDECFVDFTASEKIFGDPVKVAMEIKERIKNELGFTVNIGVAPNKILAKMASDFEKPDKLHTLFKDEIPEKMWPLPIEDLFMVGRATSEKLRSVNIKTIGELANSKKEDIEALLKSYGKLIWEYANGIDESPVLTDDDEKEKSIGNSITISHDVASKEEAYRVILWLCEKVVGRLRKQGYLATQVTVAFKTNEFKNYSHQMQTRGGISTVDEVVAYAKKLFDEGWRGEPLRLIGVTLGGLTIQAQEQLSLFDLLDKETSGIDAVNKEKSEALQKAIGQIREKYGDSAVSIASINKVKRP